eukprot:9204916-Lingulodinium_polyedra.AAC.1
MARLRETNRASGQLSPVVRAELYAALVLLPFYQIDLRSAFHPRVECSDAAPGGHGRAWTTMDERT